MKLTKSEIIAYTQMPTIKELKKEIQFLKRANSEVHNTSINKQAQIRHFRRILLLVRDKIDYLIKHPYAVDVGMTGRKDKRDDHRSKKVN